MASRGAIFMRPRNILGVELLECSTPIPLMHHGLERLATRLSRHVVREAPVKDDAAIGGCTEVHDTLPIARQRSAPGAPAKETAHR